MSENVTASSHSIPKPRLSFKQILNMSFGFFGIQFGFALKNAKIYIYINLGKKKIILLYLLIKKWKVVCLNLAWKIAHYPIKLVFKYFQNGKTNTRVYGEHFIVRL